VRLENTELFGRHARAFQISQRLADEVIAERRVGQCREQHATAGPPAGSVEDQTRRVARLLTPFQIGKRRIVKQLLIPPFGDELSAPRGITEGYLPQRFFPALLHGVVIIAEEVLVVRREPTGIEYRLGPFRLAHSVVGRGQAAARNAGDVLHLLQHAGGLALMANIDARQLFEDVRSKGGGTAATAGNRNAHQILARIGRRERLERPISR
jgi:hypothetical protein